RVEGYTDFLWVLVLAGCFDVSRLLDCDYERTAIAVNVALSVIDVALVYLVGRRLWERSWVPTAVALCLVVLDNSYTTWAALGLEGHLLAFWLLLAAYL